MSASSQQVAASVNQLATIETDTSLSTHSVAASSQEQIAAIEEITNSVIALKSMYFSIRKQR